MLLRAGALLGKSSSGLSSSHLPYVFPATSRVLCSVTSNSWGIAEKCTPQAAQCPGNTFLCLQQGVTLKSRARIRRGSPIQSTGLSAGLSNRSEGCGVRALPAHPSAHGTVLPALTSKCPKTPCRPAGKPWVLFKAAHFYALKPQEKHQVMISMKSYY